MKTDENNNITSYPVYGVFSVSSLNAIDEPGHIRHYINNNKRITYYISPSPYKAQGSSFTAPAYTEDGHIKCILLKIE